jgi:hypothetical protein
MPRHLKCALAMTMAFVLAAAAGAFAESHVRIVRLSYLNGQVQTDRATGQGLERAILNTPITQGVRVVTGDNGLAEVEFENESALRIAENSEIQFRGLSMNDNGAKVNEIEVVKGVVYLDARSKGDDIYRIKSGDSTFLVQRDTQLRLSAGPDQTRLAVFKGNVEVMDQPHVANVQRKQTLTIDPADAAGYKVATGVEALPADAWNRERQARLRTARPQLLRNVLHGARLWIRLAAVRLRQLDDRIRSLWHGRVAVLSRLWLYLRVCIPLGMAAVSLRLLGFLRRRYRMGLDSRWKLWKRLVWQWISCRSRCGQGASWLDRRGSSAGDVGSIRDADRHGW